MMRTAMSGMTVKEYKHAPANKKFLKTASNERLRQEARSLSRVTGYKDATFERAMVHSIKEELSHRMKKGKARKIGKVSHRSTRPRNTGFWFGNVRF